MKTLVTGGGGFLGQYIVEKLLERGDEVRSFSRGTYPALAELGVEQVQGDLFDAKAVSFACAGVDLVYHTAAKPGIGIRWKEYYQANTLGARHIVDACIQHQVPRLVYTGSPSVTFVGVDQCGVDESVPYPSNWLCHYPHTKALGEQYVLKHNGQGGLSTCSLRPHLIWGPRDRHLIPRLLQRARSGRLRRIGKGQNLVDMIYVENAADAHLQAADALVEPNSPVGGKAYFLSQGEPVNCWDWIDEILALADIPPVKKRISLKAAWRIGAVCEAIFKTLRLGGEPPMTRFLAAQLATHHWFDISAAQRDFGYKPAISTEEGMRRLKTDIQGS